MRLIESGEFPAVLISRGKRKKTYRIREEVLERWAMGRENGKGKNDVKLKQRKINGI